MYRVGDDAKYARPVLMGVKVEEEMLVVILHEAMLVGLAKALAKERPDILRDLFSTDDMQRI